MSLMDFFWNSENGPIENILNLAENGALILGGGMTKMAITVAALLGVSPALLGRKLDEALGLKTLADLVDLSDDEKVSATTTDVPLSAYAKGGLLGTILDKKSVMQLLKNDNKTGFLSLLKQIATKILTGGLLSVLTVSALEKANKAKSGPESSKTEPEKSVSSTKKSLEEAILKALQA